MRFFMNSNNELHLFLSCFLVIASQITKDNPSFSMVNDSDEDIMYGSDEEEEIKTPLNHFHKSQSNHHDDDSD